MNKVSLELSSLLKGMAIIFIAFCHVGNYFCRFLTPLGGIGVAIFLFISGYGLTCSYYKNGLYNYWLKRIATVFIPYLILQILTFSFHPYSSLSTFFKDVFLIHSLMPLGWFLEYLFTCYILFYLLALLPVSKNKRTIIMFCFVFAQLIFYFIFEKPIRFEQSFSFALGYVVASYDLNKIFSKKIIIITLVTAIICLALKQVGDIRANVSVMWILDLIIKTTAMWGIVSLFLLIHNNFSIFVKNLLKFFGKYSFEIYLVHAYTLLLFKLSIPKWEIILLFVLTTFPLSVLFNMLNQKIKQYLLNFKFK